jgi:hypothetical protein
MFFPSIIKNSGSSQNHINHAIFLCIVRNVGVEMFQIKIIVDIVKAI